jgi:hypothetical protein
MHMRKRKLFSILAIVVAILALQLWSSHASASEWPSMPDTPDTRPGRKLNASHMLGEPSTTRDVGSLALA